MDEIIPSYDFKGNPLETDQQLLDDPTIIDVDWGASPALSMEVFTTQVTYDAPGRPITTTDPGNNVTRHTYDESGMLFSVYLTPDGSSETSYVNGIYYDAKGQRQTIYYGNGTQTAYTYDTDTFLIQTAYDY